MKSAVWSDPEYVELVEFLIRKTEDLENPVIVRKIAEEFIKENGKSESQNCIEKRIHKFRREIHEFEEIETNSKVRLMFALSIPVGKDFLQELTKEADVFVDDENRIIEYVSTDFKLLGTHMTASRKSSSPKMDRFEIQKNMMEFMMEKTKESSSPISQSRFLKEFRVATVSMNTEEVLKSRYRSMLSMIYESEIEEETKIKMLFVSGARLHNLELDELRKNAIVEVDDQNRIIKYSAKNGKLDLKKSPSLIDYLKESCLETDSPLIIIKIANDFKKESGSMDSVFDLRDRIIKYRENIHKLNFLEKEMKVKMLFGLGVSVDPGFLEKLRKTALVEVDAENRIIKYQDENLHLQGVHSVKEEPVDHVESPVPPSKNNKRKLEVCTSSPKRLKQEAPEETSKIRILEAFHSLIVALNSSILDDFRMKIEKKMEEVKEENVPTASLLRGMESCIDGFARNSTMNKGCISLQGILWSIKCILINSKFKGMESFYEKLMETINAFPLQEIPIEKIEGVIQNALNIIQI